MIEVEPATHGRPVDKKSIDGIEVLNSVIFPRLHLQDCLQELKSGTVFEGLRLEHFRSSNRACRDTNIAVAALSGLISRKLLRTKTDHLRGKVLKAGGFFAFGTSAYHTVAALHKTARQLKLDSNYRVTQDLL